MNNNLQIIYSKIKGKVTNQQVLYILGGVTAKALVSFEKEYYNTEFSFDFAKLLIESLDNTALSNDKFIEILVLDLLLDVDIVKLLEILKIPGTANFTNRENICSKSKKVKAKAISELLDLELNYFIEDSKNQKTLEHELVSPYSPLDIKDPGIEIPKEYLCLHDYQKRVKDTATKILIEDQKKKFMIHMPTGSGKTKTCVETMIDYMRTVISEEGFVIWFAHSKELCEQSYTTLKNMWKFRGDESVDFYKVFGDTDINLDLLNKKRAVLFIGFQKFNSILGSKNKDYVSFRTKIANRAKLVVVDEAHKSMAPTYKKAIDYCQSNFDDCKLIGLTATPGRTNEDSEENKFLAEYFDDNLITIKDAHGVEQNNPLKYLQEENVLAEIEDEILNFDLTVNTPLYSNAEELTKSQLEEIANQAVINPSRNNTIRETVKERLEKNSKESILIFAASTAHCIVLDMIFKKENITSKYVLGSTKKEERVESIQDFKDKKLNVLINYSVLSTGFDAPLLNTLIIARTINSKILGSQIIGRALRGERNGGNKKNKIIVLKDNITGLDPSFLFSYWEEFWGKKYTN
jgi:superfamily II DNA or RNA helicase